MKERDRAWAVLGDQLPQFAGNLIHRLRAGCFHVPARGLTLEAVYEAVLRPVVEVNGGEPLDAHVAAIRGDATVAGSSDQLVSFDCQLHGTEGAAVATERLGSAPRWGLSSHCG